MAKIRQSDACGWKEFPGPKFSQQERWDKFFCKNVCDLYLRFACLRWIGQKFQTSSPFFWWWVFSWWWIQRLVESENKNDKEHTSKKVVERFSGGDSGGVFCFSNKNLTKPLGSDWFIGVLLSLAYDITPLFVTAIPLFFQQITRHPPVTAQTILAQKRTVGIWGNPEDFAERSISIHFPLLFCYVRKYRSVFNGKKPWEIHNIFIFFGSGAYKPPRKKKHTKKVIPPFSAGLIIWHQTQTRCVFSIRENSLQNHQQPFASSWILPPKMGSNSTTTRYEENGYVWFNWWLWKKHPKISDGFNTSEMILVKLDHFPT